MPQAAGRVDALATRPHRSRRSMTSRPAELRTVSLALLQVLPQRTTQKFRMGHACLPTLEAAFISMFIYKLQINDRQNRPHRSIYLHRDHVRKRINMTSAPYDKSCSHEICKFEYLRWIKIIGKVVPKYSTKANFKVCVKQMPSFRPY
jgi:hypothetical protein